jgi:hypothetical protein
MNTKTLWLAIPVLAVGTLAAFPPAPEKADLTPAELLETATHVVVGEVRQIYVRDDSDSRWKCTRYCAEIAVSNLEKGEQSEVQELVYARYWQRRWNGWGTPPADTNGHRGLPKVGDKVRVYLARNAYDGFGKVEDSGFTVIGANGFAAP